MPITYDELRDTIDRVRDKLARGGDTPPERPPEMIETHYVQLTSATKVGGRYPAQRMEHDGLANTFVAREACWVITPNNEDLIVGSPAINWTAKLSGADADGVAIYDAIGPFWKYRYICSSACSGSGSVFTCAPPHLDLSYTVTNIVGLCSDLPTSGTMIYGASEWLDVTPSTSCGQNFGSSGHGLVAVSCTTVGGVVTPMASIGNGILANAQPGWTANPLSAVFLINDGLGNSCTLTVVE